MWFMASVLADIYGFTIVRLCQMENFPEHLIYSDCLLSKARLYHVSIQKGNKGNPVHVKHENQSCIRAAVSFCFMELVLAGTCGFLLVQICQAKFGTRSNKSIAALLVGTWYITCGYQSPQD